MACLVTRKRVLCMVVRIVLISWTNGLRIERPVPYKRCLRIRAGRKVYELASDGSRWPLSTTTIEERRRAWTRGKRRRLGGFARRIFVPEQVVESYYRYSQWRCLQRLLSATVNVFGLQAMIMAVGVRDAASGRGIGTAAAIDWVLKDALGKLTRLAWAGKMGRSFDGDAKRWRFRSSLLYATGNGLQIATYAFPSFFLILATLANCLKQVSMLTSTATRSAIYRSFAKTDATNNIGDITAKGEAQIAVVDLLGMALGIGLTKALGFDKKGIVMAYITLSLAEIATMYFEIRSVIFKQLNLDRALATTHAFVHKEPLPTPAYFAATQERLLLPPTQSTKSVFAPLSMLNATLVSEIADHFAQEPFLLVPNSDLNNTPIDCSIVLKPIAEDTDILRALLARAIFLRDQTHPSLARHKADARLDAFLSDLRQAGWSTYSYIFPEIRTRADW